jgi:TolB-like protein/class 3 adenylate cyclase/Flp pilus assembly protein TadD
MAAEVKKEIELEIAHVLFIDIVGYTTLLINDQRTLFQKLNRVVRETDQFRKAEESGVLLKLPTGDGMALVFRSSPEAPVECALEVSRALKDDPSLRVRMGIHSGPISGVVDVDGKANVAGAGINVAQRVMDCGDAGHILLSKRVAEDLEQYGHWQPLLHDLGECEVKHGMRLSVVNLYSDELGNPEMPDKLKSAKASAPEPAARNKLHLTVIAAVTCLAIVAAGLLFLHPWRRTQVSARAPVALNVPEKSIAVLPFENFSESKENEFFADGVQDDILTALARVADLKVISRISVMTYAAGAKRNLREIAQALGVSHILEGSVRRANGKVRVTAQLIDARTDAHLWADTYDRDLADVFAIQSEIARKIVDQLQARLSPSEKAAIEAPPTKDVAAHDLYVRAKLLNESSSFSSRRLEKLVEAAGLLDQAVARDPEFFLAHCLLSNTHGLIYFYGLDHTPSRRALAEAAVKAASRLRPEAGETHLARADVLYRCYLDYDRARSELTLAQRALPNNAQVLVLIGYIDRRQGRWTESVQEMERALELDPRNWFYLQQISLTYQFLRRFADMAAALDRVQAILPDDVNTRVVRALADLESRADPRPLRETIDAALQKDPASATGFANIFIYFALCERDLNAADRAIAAMPPQGVGVNAVLLPIPFWKGFVARMEGDASAAQQAFLAARDQAQEIVKEQPDYGPAVCVLGLIDAALGRKEQAITESRKAVELLPVTKDAVNGMNVEEYLAVTYAWTGERDLAIEQLRRTLQHPGFISYGQLKLHPYWDSLRGDPRFEKVVADLAPKP